MNIPYHLNLESTLVAASGQPQMNRAAAKASAHDSLHGLPVSSASVVSASAVTVPCLCAMGTHTKLLHPLVSICVVTICKKTLARYQQCEHACRVSTCSTVVQTDFTIIDRVGCHKPWQQSWCSSTYFTCMP